MQIELLPASDADQPTVANLVQLYLHDLVESGGPAPDERGRFSHPDLDAYWAEPGRHAFLIRADGRVAGFVLVRRSSRLHQPFDGHCIADIFVLRGCRRAGVGSAAASRLFDMLPGRWELAAPAANVPATAFLRALSQRYTCGQYTEVFAQQDGWRGTVESFVSPSPCQG